MTGMNGKRKRLSGAGGEFIPRMQFSRWQPAEILHIKRMLGCWLNQPPPDVQVQQVRFANKNLFHPLRHQRGCCIPLIPRGNFIPRLELLNRATYNQSLF